MATTTLGKWKFVLAALDAFNSEKRSSEIAFTLADMAAEIRQRVLRAEEYRLKVIVPKHQQHEGEGDQRRPLFATGPEGRETQEPIFVEGGRAAYQREVDQMDDEQVEIAVPLLSKEKFRKAAGSMIAPWIIEALAPVFATPQAGAKQAIPAPQFESPAVSPGEAPVIPLPVQKAGARPPMPSGG